METLAKEVAGQGAVSTLVRATLLDHARTHYGQLAGRRSLAPVSYVGMGIAEEHRTHGRMPGEGYTQAPKRAHTHTHMRALAPPPLLLPRYGTTGAICSPQMRAQPRASAGAAGRSCTCCWLINAATSLRDISARSPLTGSVSVLASVVAASVAAGVAGGESKEGAGRDAATLASVPLAPRLRRWLRGKGARAHAHWRSTRACASGHPARQR